MNHGTSCPKSAITGCAVLLALSSNLLSTPSRAQPAPPDRNVALRGEVLDAQSQKPLPCRLYIQAAGGSWHFAKSDSPSGSAIEYHKQKEWNPACVEMHTTLSAHPFIAHLPPGTYTVLVERGKEYLPHSQVV